MLIAIGNSGDVILRPEAERLLSDKSPLVRGAAVWALSQLMAPEEFVALAVEYADAESDEAVRAEWADARSQKRLDRDKLTMKRFNALWLARRGHASQPRWFSYAFRWV